MSIDLNWETVTGGPDGLELAHQIRDFIHARFQTVPLPRFIKSVTVHDFEFGSIPPELELKDITDPLPDFYAENADIDDADSDADSSDDDSNYSPDDLRASSDRRKAGTENARGGADTGLISRGDRAAAAYPRPHLNLGSSMLEGRNRRRSKSPTKQLNEAGAGSPFLRVSTPGIPGGTSNMSYFHSHFGSALSGTQTPLAAMAGAHHLGNSWLEAHHGHSTSAPNLRQQYARAMERNAENQLGHSRERNTSQSSSILDFNQNQAGHNIGLAPGIHSPSSPASPSGPPAGLGILGAPSVPHPLREKHSVSTLAPTSVGTSRPPTRDAMGILGGDHEGTVPNPDSDGSSPHNENDESPQGRFREPRVEDIQAVFRIKYAGDIKLLLTADILLDYPMPSFVGIPVHLSITGLTFDGVGVLANIRKRVHFCFLSPEDAVAAIGGEENIDTTEEDRRPSSTGNVKIGGLLQEIRVESEIGQRDSGKQSLKNVGKVERFVLEQVRRIFEEELVYPSFWTFLV
ncbi:hypothetical protein V8F06_000214 [Rhypophila decipiens]